MSSEVSANMRNPNYDFDEEIYDDFDDDEISTSSYNNRQDTNHNINGSNIVSGSSRESSVPLTTIRARDMEIEPGTKSGIFGASSNLVNSIVGAGIIGIPYAIKNSGLIVGVFMLFVVAFLTNESLRIMIEAASFHPQLYKRNITTFEDLMSYPFGNIGSNFILLNMFIAAYGAMVAYLLIIKDTVPTLLGIAHGIDGGIEREIVLIITSITIMVPLSMQRDMASLAFTSLLSISADVILVGFVLVFSPVQTSVQSIGGVVELLKQDSIEPTLFIGLGILSTAMACQHSAFIVYGSLENGTRSRWATVTKNSIGISALLCAVLGVSGYLGYLDETQGDILNNFEAGSIAANGARALLAITMFFTYPMEAFVGRHVLIKLFYNGVSENPSDQNSMFPNRIKRITLGLYILTLIPALIFDDLGPVLSITGALGGSCISYIAPGMIYLGVNGDAFLLHCKEMLETYRRRRHGLSEDENKGIELPVTGNADRVVVNSISSAHGVDRGMDLPIEGKNIKMTTSDFGPKPYWWYLLGYHFWYRIASEGSAGMKRMLDGTERNGCTNHNEESIADDIVLPTAGQFNLAIFFILFGLVALSVGLASNIYVQMNDLD